MAEKRPKAGTGRFSDKVSANLVREAEKSIGKIGASNMGVRTLEILASRGKEIAEMTSGVAGAGTKLQGLARKELIKRGLKVPGE